MDMIVRDALAGRLSRRQALMASAISVLASSLGGTASAAVGDQELWRFCEKCFSMFYNGGGSNKGKCPADGDIHVAQGFSFTPHFDDGTPGQANVQ